MRRIVPGTLLALTAPAWAQNALGDGRGLEAPVEVTAPRDRGAAARRLNSELQFRNAIVTGNAPGGMSFRGDVGYTAPGEFRGDLGSNDLFAFRRDTFYAGLSGYGIRGTEAVQYQFALTTGSRAPSGLLGAPIVDRAGGAAPTAVPGARRVGESGLYLDPLARDEGFGGSMFGTLRSTSAYEANRGYQPSILGYRMDPDQNRYGMTASSLEGIRMLPIDEPTRPGASARIDRSATPTRLETRIDPIVTAHDLVRERLRAPGETEEDFARFRTSLDELRRQMFMLEDAGDEPTPDSPLIPAPRPEDPDEPDDAEGDKPEVPDALRGIDPAVLERLRAAGLPIETLARGGDGRDVYREHMARAERFMQEGRYFDAEERYTRAMSVREGDVSARIGRAHAQIGAGLYLSAAVNLRLAITDHPEIVGNKYATALIPSGQRGDRVMEQLAANVSAWDAGGPDRLGAESALLLAYMGYQRGERAPVERGLDALAGSAAEGDRALVVLLRFVWLGESIEDAAESGGG